jgi:transcriptional regulator with XRE-family HTH domain
MEEMKTLGERIRYIRKLQDLTQEALGDHLGRTSAAVGAWEAGTNDPKIPELVKIAKLGETSIDWLCTGSKANESEPISEAALEIARLFDGCSQKHQMAIFTSLSSCYRDSQKKG